MIPDAIMHPDVRPFGPFSDANPFLDRLSLFDLHVGLVALGGLGLGAMIRAANRGDPGAR